MGPIQRVFVKFMKARECWKEYKTETEKRLKQKGVTATAERFIEAVPPGLFIKGGVDWGTSRMGSEYWEMINSGWLKHF